MEKQAELVKVAEASEIPDGGTKVVSIKGRAIGIFRVKDEYFAMNNTCLHRGGPLGEGDLQEFTITCPWHGWSYDVRTGSFDLIPTMKIRTYPTRIENGSIFVEIA